MTEEKINERFDEPEIGSVPEEMYEEVDEELDLEFREDDIEDMYEEAEEAGGFEEEAEDDAFQVLSGKREKSEQSRKKWLLVSAAVFAIAAVSVGVIGWRRKR